MKKKISPHPLFIRSLVILLLLVSLALSGSEASARSLSVGIKQGATFGSLGGDASVTDAGGQSFRISGESGVSLSGGDLLIAQRALRMPVKITSSAPIVWEKTRYRGELRLIATPGGFTVINDVDLEDYLRGILKIEMNPDWPQEALRAQAILARTYALRNDGRHRQQGFDVCALSHCQNYRGVNAETERTDLAINATKGQALTWNGGVADIYYHSDSGGATSDIASVWGGKSAYLITRQEPVPYTSPHSNWSALLSASQVESALSKMGKPVGSLLSLRVLERDGSGRVALLEIQGSLGVQRVKGHAFRMAVGSNLLKSTNFDIVGNEVSASPATLNPNPPATTISFKTDPLVEMTRLGIFSSKELMEMLLYPENRDKYMQMAADRLGGKLSMPMTEQPPAPQSVSVAPPTSASGGIRIAGKGWGHGVGLSQWGAKALAEQGWSYQQILEHYFPGTRVAQ